MEGSDLAYQRFLKEEKEDRLKLAYSIASLDSGDPFAADTHLDDDMREALDWQATRSSRDIIGMSLSLHTHPWMCAVSPLQMREKR